MPSYRSAAAGLLCVFASLSALGCSSSASSKSSAQTTDATAERPSPSVSGTASSAAAPADTPLVATVGAATSTANSSPPRGARAVVVGHVDGDTLDVVVQGAGRERLRLIGIDTPETKKPNSPVECYGPEASAHLVEVLPLGSEVVLLRDVEARDDYGRFLAYLFRGSDGLFVNLEIVSAGYARVLSIAPNTMFATEVSQAAADARNGRRGLWSICPEPSRKTKPT